MAEPPPRCLLALCPGRAGTLKRWPPQSLQHHWGPGSELPDTSSHDAGSGSGSGSGGKGPSTVESGEQP